MCRRRVACSRRIPARAVPLCGPPGSVSRSWTTPWSTKAREYVSADLGTDLGTVRGYEARVRWPDWRRVCAHAYFNLELQKSATWNISSICCTTLASGRGDVRGDSRNRNAPRNNRTTEQQGTWRHGQAVRDGPNSVCAAIVPHLRGSESQCTTSPLILLSNGSPQEENAAHLTIRVGCEQSWRLQLQRSMGALYLF